MKVSTLEKVLRALASVYAGREGWDPAWETA